MSALISSGPNALANIKPLNSSDQGNQHGSREDWPIAVEVFHEEVARKFALATLATRRHVDDADATS